MQTARRYKLPKVHKNGSSLWPVLSIPGSSYENLTKFLSPFFQKIPGANIETNLEDSRITLEATKLDEYEPVVSLGVKSLCTKPVEETIGIALREVYSSDEVPEIPRSIMKILLRLAVRNIQFNYNKIWYTHSYFLAMGALLAAILENLWRKFFEIHLQKPIDGRENKNDMKRTCIDCNRPITFRGKGVNCESCKNWFHAKCQNITDT